MKLKRLDVKRPVLKTAPMEPIDASDFKVRCLAILDRVAETGESVIIVKRGQPVAELRPAVCPDAAYPQYELKGTVVEVGEIVEPAVPADHWESTRR